MPAHRFPRFAIAILAGGRARRLGGRDKASLVVAGRSIIQRQLDAVSGLTPELFVVARDVERVTIPPGIRVVTDLVHGAGALGGIYTAVKLARASRVLVLACDMPFLTAAFLVHLMQAAEETDADAVVPVTDRGYEPLCAVYGRRAADAAERLIASGDLRLTTLIAAVRTEFLTEDDIALYDPDGSLFVNVNTPEDYTDALSRKVSS